MRDGKHKLLRRIAELTAPTMFALSLTFLVCQAILIVIWVDVPNFSENAALAINPDNPQAQRLQAALAEHQDHQSWIQDFAMYLILAIWPIVIFESAMHWMTRSWQKATRRYHFFGLLFCAMPSMRMCARSPEMHGRLWLPRLGWRQPNKRLRRRLEKRFSVPMILIALLIMPVLIIEFFMKTQVAEYEWLRLMLHISTGIIWFAFAAEFILMVSVADKKIAYCRRHWIDIAIIILPLFSFLRSLRVIRTTKAVKLVRIQQITKLARVYRLRGTAVKALQALFVLDSVERLLNSNTERTIERLQRQLDELESESNLIRRRISKLERKLREEEAEQCISEDLAQRE